MSHPSGRQPSCQPPAPSAAGFAGWQTAWDYWVDAWQRTVLFWDVFRQRNQQCDAEKAKAVPHVLSFDAELVLDGRTFERPVNYGLVRIKPPQRVVIDPKKRPFVVVGRPGPGIAGFKADGITRGS